jgi:hypothetical protein
VRVKAEPVRQIADDPLHGNRVSQHLDIIHEALAASGLDEAGHHAYRGRLARPVGPHEAAHLAFFDPDVNRVDSLNAAIYFCQIFRPYHIPHTAEVSMLFRLMLTSADRLTRLNIKH